MALNEFRTIAFPSIATGTYGYPLKEASLVVVTEAISWMTEGSNKDSVDLILFCTHTSEDYAYYQRTLTALKNSYKARESSKTLRPSRQLKQLEPQQPTPQLHTLGQQGRASKRSRSGERLHSQPRNYPTALITALPNRISPAPTQETNNHARSQAPLSTL